MSASRREICGQLIHWEHLHGTLVFREGYFHGRCPASGRRIMQRKRPMLGAKCGLPSCVCRMGSVADNDPDQMLNDGDPGEP